jgi:isoamylase/glycogen operon protein
MLNKIKIHENRPKKLGLSKENNILFFSLFSSHAEKISISLQYLGEIREIPLIQEGSIWHIGIEGLQEETIYAFKLEAPNKPSTLLADPYAHYPATPSKWGEKQLLNGSYCRLPKPFDWQGVKNPEIPLQNLIIYEMHVRGFSIDLSSRSSHPGTFSGVIEKIPYLKKLGVNAVELMPIFEFNETFCKHPPLLNYWGYDPLFFFAPMRRFCSTDDPVQEFQTCVRELHRNGIEVILDVVYNHTGEGDNPAQTVHFRGIDNSVYYMLDDQSRYLNFAGCGNTFNTNHPQVMQFIIDSLKFWVQEMHVDGFRFDLASILTRDPSGNVVQDPPILDRIKKEPLFQKTKFISESWDAAGLYQVGTFANLGPWSEWNDQFQTFVRRFIKGDESTEGRFADCLTGCEFIFKGKSPTRSINYITVHDGFSLMDLVSYSQKHNFPNGEQNRDGNNNSNSCNCGHEGATQDPIITSLREKQMRNFFLALFLAQGVPILFMGDEYGHTRKGNNNPYVQDNQINWFQWNQRPDIFQFVSALIAFRKNSPSLKKAHFLRDQEIDWHGKEPFKPDWTSKECFVAFTLNGTPSLFIAFNASPNPITLTLPPNHTWKALVETETGWNHHLGAPEKAPQLKASYTLPSHAALLARSL